MPMLNHFAPPLSRHRNWTGFHSLWANVIAIHLNRTLPAGWVAEPHVQWRQEADAIVVEDVDPPPAFTTAGPAGEGGTAVVEPPVAVAIPPRRSLEFDTDHDVTEVRVLDERGKSLRLAAAVEIISPSNKDRPDERAAFVNKVGGYVAAGLGVAVLDPVFSSPRGLHRAVMQSLGDDDPEADATYAAAYRLTPGERRRLELWYEPLAVGAALPSLPLFLKGGPAVELPLEATYAEACLNTRVDMAAVLKEQP